MAPSGKVEGRSDRDAALPIRLGGVVAAVLVLLGIVLGIAVDSDWLFRLVPLGVGLAIGALLADRRRAVG